MTIYHNPRCMKSRQTLALIKEKGIKPEIRLYLKDVPSVEEFKLVLAKLNMNASDLVRRNEAIYKERLKGMTFTEDEWITILLESPKLIERPIVLKGHKGVIGRPPENVLQLF